MISSRTGWMGFLLISLLPTNEDVSIVCGWRLLLMVSSLKSISSLFVYFSLMKDSGLGVGWRRLSAGD